MAVLHLPWQEPEKIKAKLEKLFDKLNETFPDKVVVSLNQFSSRETLRKYSKELGYEDLRTFLSAYGYDYPVSNDGGSSGHLGGRPVQNKPQEIIDTLLSRYPDGAKFEKLGELKGDNPDLAPKFKSLMNTAQKLFGMPLGDYFVQIGLLIGITKAERRAGATQDPLEKAERKEAKSQEEQDLLATVVAALKERYSGKIPPDSIKVLSENNADLPINDIGYLVKKHYAKTASNWFIEQGVLVADFKQAVMDKYLPGKNILTLEADELLNFIKSLITPFDGEFKGKHFVGRTGMEYETRQEIEKRGGTSHDVSMTKCDYLVVCLIRCEWSKDPMWTGKGTLERIQKALILQEQGENIKIISLNDIEAKMPEILKKRERRKFEYQKYREEQALEAEKERQAELRKEQERNVTSTKADFVIKDGVLRKYTGAAGIVIIPDGVKAIAKDVFKKNDAIYSVAIPKSVKEIGDRAFSGCEELTHVELSEGLKTLGISAFRDCVALKSIDIPKSVKEIGNHAFDNCGDFSGWYGRFSIQSSSNAEFDEGGGGHGSPGLFGYSTKIVRSSEKAPFTIFVYSKGTSSEEDSLIARMLREDGDYTQAEEYFLKSKCTRKFKKILPMIVRDLEAVKKLAKFVAIDAKTVKEYMNAAEAVKANEVVEYLKKFADKNISADDTAKAAKKADSAAAKQKQKEEALIAVFGEFTTDGLKKITEKGGGMVKVKFLDGRAYKYWCGFEVQIGDKVLVEGSRKGQVGAIAEIEDDKAYRYSGQSYILDDKILSVTAAYRA
jgi:hypothetical protein